VVARLDDLRLQLQPHLVAGADELDLLDVEAELVQPVQSRLEPLGLVGREHLVRRQLLPQRVVPPANVADELVGIRDGPAELGLEVVQLAGEVLLRDRQIVGALPVGETLVQLARLRVDEVGGERAGVAAEERVRQRAVAPEEAGEVQPDEQLGERGANRGLGSGQRLAAEDQPVRKRELEVARDEDVRQVVALRDDADRLDRGDLAVGELAEQAVLAVGERRRELLQRVERAVQPDEADDVAADPAQHLDDALGGPLLERHVPRQLEERRLIGARAEAEMWAGRGHSS
jgi:hypothetical protein